MLFVQTFFSYTLLAIIMFASVKWTNNKKYFIIIPIISYTLFFGLRYGVGIDYYHYVELFKEWGNRDFMYRFERFEIRYELAFLYIMDFCYKMKYDSFVFLSIFAFIQIFFITFSFKKEERGVLAFFYIMLIVTGTAMGTFCNTIRQGVAICIFLFSIQFLTNRKYYYLYIICIFIATMFHVSAIALLLLLFLPRPKQGIFTNKYISIATIVLSYILSFYAPLQNFTNINILRPIFISLNYESYDYSFTTREDVGLMDLLYLFLYIIILYNSSKIKTFYDNPKVTFYFDLFIIGTVISYLFSSNLAMQRLTSYLVIFQLIIIAYALYYYFSIENKITFKILISAILLLSYFRIIYYSEDSTIQYATIFQDEYKPTKDAQYNKIMYHRSNKSLK